VTSSTKLTDKFVTALKPQDKNYDVWDSDVKGFLVRVFVTGAKSFRYSYYFQGKRKAFTIGKFGTLTTAQAREIVKQKAGQVATGIDVQSEKANARADAILRDGLTLQRFIETSYNDWREANRKRAPESLRRLRVCFFDDFGKRSLDTITRWDIEKWSTARLNGGIAPDTINRDIAELRAVFSKAVEWDVLQTSPLDKLKSAKVDRSPKVRFLTVDEERALRNALAQRDERLKQKRINANKWRLQRKYDLLPDLSLQTYADHLSPMVLLSINTGLRRGELFGLTWDHVDLEQATLTVVGDISKSGQTRHIPLNIEAKKALLLCKSTSSALQTFVFQNNDGLPFDNVQTSWERVLKDAKIDNFRWHDLRHHFASRLVMAGIDLNTVRELLGHSDMKVTLRYAHLAPEHKARAVSILDNILLND